MKKLSLLIFLLCGIISFSQTNDKIKNRGELRKLALNDSQLQKLQKFKDSIASVLQLADSGKIKEDFSRSMNYILELQKERKARQKKAAIIRIAIGAAFLIILIIGLRRRKK
ncbi:MAG: hypothetical protein V9F01_13780 [Chitinophagaceae bacterium]